MKRGIRSGAAGFTLVELLIAVAIIGLLAAIALPQLLGSREKAKRAKCDEFAHALDAEVHLEGQKQMDARAPWPGLYAAFYVAQRHFERNPIVTPNAPQCTENFGFNPNCAFILQFVPQAMARCQTMMYPVPAPDDRLTMYYKDYDSVTRSYVISFDR